MTYDWLIYIHSADWYSLTINYVVTVCKKYLYIHVDVEKNNPSIQTFR